MNKEFHYWITAIIADKAGFTNDETRKIAYSSQYVDDNDEDINVYDDELSTLPSYQNHISQTMNILLPRKDLRDIYPMFHFIPGDQGNASKRNDNKTHPLNTTPDSLYANQIIKTALKVVRDNEITGLYRLGIATHAFADTWAHQNFTGSWDGFNDMGNAITPDVGHADALHHPDWVGHRWTDDRLIDPNISNNTRYIAAARKIYTVFTEYTSNSGRNITGDWSALEGELLNIFGQTYSGDSEQGKDRRNELYRQQVPWLEDYEDGKWQTTALEVKTVPEGGSDNYVERYFWRKHISKTDTDWYKFQEAVKAHIADAKSILQHVIALAGMA